MNKIKKLNEDGKLKVSIKNGSVLQYYRATPFTEHGEFNYNGMLKADFFFEHMFSKVGKCDEYLKEISDSLKENQHKSIILIGNQGCGKTTFIHYLVRTCSNHNFIFFDFDKDTSNSNLSAYIEKLSVHLHNLIKRNDNVNKVFYDLYIRNKDLINQKINANNNINNFFSDFKDVFLTSHFLRSSIKSEEFIKKINSLYFNQILSLIMLWHMCELKYNNISSSEVKSTVFCLDNFDVLINKEIIEKFFAEYFLFVRNVDSIIQNIDDKYFNEIKKSYNQMFAFIICCRQHTWARVREIYRHDNAFIRISTFEKNITDAFVKSEILTKREEYIKCNENYYGSFADEVTEVKNLLSDMDTENYHNVYDLFDDDYRQCTITFEQLIHSNKELIRSYTNVRNKLSGTPLYCARGLIYKALFEKFKSEEIFKSIGVLDVTSNEPLVSNARMLLTYLNHYTYSKNRNVQNAVPFNKIVSDFNGIITKDDINAALIAMFKLGDDSTWNELIAFTEIHSEEVETCEGLDVFITKAGHEYLSFIATHFEFFSTRVVKPKKNNVALFDDIMMQYDPKNKKFNFQEAIDNVLDIVNHCCQRMSEYYNKYMKSKYDNIDDYLESPFVYHEAAVLHGERIIHTHIRYIDFYRLYLLKVIDDESIDKENLNKILVEYIEKYMEIGDNHPDILTEKSTKVLFPAFRDKIKDIRESGFKDFTTKIDIDYNAR